uniref:Protein kinase domain-containing protein n=1 Tax=Oryza punctata TaxID=4537 RepID=A0A0E0MIR0_ORYPU
MPSLVAAAAVLGKIRHPNLLPLRAYYLGPKGEKLLVLDFVPNGSLSQFLHGHNSVLSTAANSNVLAAAGALGYRAPELSKLKKVSAKTDVCSLGVIILELLTGKSPAETTNGMDLPHWVASIVKEEWTSEVFDLELMRDGDTGPGGDELVDTLKLALHCVDQSPSVRPDAREVLRQLEQIRPGLEGGAGPSEEGGAGHVAAASAGNE